MHACMHVHMHIEIDRRPSTPDILNPQPEPYTIPPDALWEVSALMRLFYLLQNLQNHVPRPKP